MNQWLLKALRTRRRQLAETETTLEKRAERLMVAAMNRPTVSLTAEMDFLLTAASLTWTRRRKEWILRLIRRLEKKPTR